MLGTTLLNKTHRQMKIPIIQNYCTNKNIYFHPIVFTCFRRNFNHIILQSPIKGSHQLI